MKINGRHNYNNLEKLLYIHVSQLKTYNRFKIKL